MKSNARKRFSILALSAVLCLFLSGCGAKALDLNALRQSDGSYDLTDIPLGSSVEETAKALGVPLKAPSYQRNGIDVYRTEGPYTLDGQKLPMTLEFSGDGLQVVAFYPNATEETYSKLYDELTSAYGEPSQSAESDSQVFDGKMSSKGALWRASGEKETLLQLTLVSGEKVETSLSLMIGYGQ